MIRKLPVSTLISIKKLRVVLSFGIKGYLADNGWFNAFLQKSPIGAENEPIPWVTYSFIDFIEPRLNQNQTIFEYGAGNSTLYYCKKVKEVVSVENDKIWMEKLSENKPNNSTLIYSELVYGGEYSMKSTTINKNFDLIIVDGRDRVNCCKNAIQALTSSGVIVLDDSERKQYSPAFDFLKEKGFRELTFTGIAPGLFHTKATTVFYRDGNCLGI